MQELLVPELVHQHESKQEASIKYGLFQEHQESETLGYSAPTLVMGITSAPPQLLLLPAT